jgi:hypothetical protein
MPSWLVDDPTTVLAVLGLAGFGVGVAWWLTRRRGYLFGVAAAVGLMVAVWLLHRFVETDAKRIERVVRAMAAGVPARDADRIFAHISDDFRLRGQTAKADFRRTVEGHLRRGDVTDLAVYAFNPLEIARNKRSATVLFGAKGKGPGFQGYEMYNVKAFFVLDPDGQWRLKDFRLYLPQVDPGTGEEITLPL